MLESLLFRAEVRFPCCPGRSYFVDRDDDLVTKQISGATQQIPDTLPRPQIKGEPDTSADVVVIGAGPTGLACAIEAQRAGFKTMAIDKGCVVNSIYNYPANMSFFTTPELLEIGDIPFSTAHQKPTREEALEYYRKVTEHYHLDVRQYQWVKTVTGSDGDFQITATDSLGRIYDYRTRKLIVSTGYYDLSNPLNIPGEDLPKVFHYYREPHPFFDMDVVVIGGKNSAAISALDLWRHGARVTLVHRGSKLHNHVKYWILPDIENRIKNREIAAYFRQHGGRNRSRLRQSGNSRRPGPVEERFCLRHDRLPSRLRFPAFDGHRALRRTVPSGVRSADPGEQCAGDLRGRSDRGRVTRPTKSSSKTEGFTAGRSPPI